jgi:hypothetical protein
MTKPVLPNLGDHIVQILEKNNYPMKPEGLTFRVAEIAHKSYMEVRYPVQKALTKLVKEGRIERPRRGEYQCK